MREKSPQLRLCWQNDATSQQKLLSQVQSVICWCFLHDTFQVGFFSKEQRRHESYETYGYLRIETSGIRGSKDGHGHGTAQSGLGLYFALSQDAECSLSKVRNPVFIQKRPLSVFLHQFSSLCIHTYKIVIEIAKTCFKGAIASPDPEMLHRSGCTSFLQLLQLKGSLQQLLCTQLDMMLSEKPTPLPRDSPGFPSLCVVQSWRTVLWAKGTGEVAPDKDIWPQLWTLLCQWNIYDDMLPSNDQIALNRQERKYTMEYGNQGETVKRKKIHQGKNNSK